MEHLLYKDSKISSRFSVLVFLINSFGLLVDTDCYLLHCFQLEDSLCMYVCERERKRMRDREREYVCVCIFLCLCV